MADLSITIEYDPATNETIIIDTNGTTQADSDTAEFIRVALANSIESIAESFGTAQGKIVQVINVREDFQNYLETEQASHPTEDVRNYFVAGFQEAGNFVASAGGAFVGARAGFLSGFAINAAICLLDVPVGLISTALTAGVGGIVGATMAEDEYNDYVLENGQTAAQNVGNFARDLWEVGEDIIDSLSFNADEKYISLSINDLAELELVQANDSGIHMEGPGLSLSNLTVPDIYKLINDYKNFDGLSSSLTIDTKDLDTLSTESRTFGYTAGTGSNDTMSGGSNSDILLGDQGDDTIHGNGGDDVIDGSEGNDTINGNDGNDYIDGGVGADTLNGGNGNDIIHAGNDGDTVSGGNDDDTIYGDEGADTLNGDAGNDYINGGTGDDIIDGGDGNDTIYGGDGYDTLTGGDGNDTIDAGIGTDSLTGGAGNDILRGGTGNDLYFIAETGEGLDIIDDADGGLISIGTNISTTTFTSTDGGLYHSSYVNIATDHWNFYAIYKAGGDLILYKEYQTPVGGGTHTGGWSPGTNSVKLVGAASDPSKYGITLVNSQAGTAGNDTINGTQYDDTIHGNNGNDTINGNDGGDTLYGDIGVDNISGGLGDDTIYGGDGNDTLNGNDDNDVMFGDAGIDTINGNNGNDEMHGGNDGDTMNGNDGNDQLFGDDGVDYLYGGDGNDTIDAGTGNDKIYGGAGNDTMSGGTGSDNFYIAPTVVGSIETGVGLDTISDSDTGYVVLGSTGITGNFINDGTNEYDGQYFFNISTAYNAWFSVKVSGSDLTLYQTARSGMPAGATGAWDTSNDKITLVGGGNDPSKYGINLVTNYNGTSGSDNIDGTPYSDNVYTYNGNDTIDSKAGNDYVNGGDGDDIILPGSGTDTVYGGNGSDTIKYSGSAVTLNFTNLTASGGDAAGDSIFDVENADVTSGNDILVGNAATNFFWGNAGADNLNGKGGADTLYGGSGADTFTFTSKSDSTDTAKDSIMDFESGDKISLVGLGFSHVTDFTVTQSGGYTDFNDNNSTFDFKLFGSLTLTDSDFIFS